MARSSRRALVVSRRRACIPSERPSCHPRTSPMLPHPLSCPLGWVPGGCGAWAARSSDADSLRRRAALDRPHGRAPRGALPCAAVLTATPGRLEIRATPEHEVEVGAATAVAPPPLPPPLTQAAASFGFVFRVVPLLLSLSVRSLTILDVLARHPLAEALQELPVQGPPARRAGEAGHVGGERTRSLSLSLCVESGARTGRESGFAAMGETRLRSLRLSGGFTRCAGVCTQLACARW